MDCYGNPCEIVTFLLLCPLFQHTYTTSKVLITDCIPSRDIRTILTSIRNSAINTLFSLIYVMFLKATKSCHPNRLKPIILHPIIPAIYLVLHFSTDPVLARGFLARDSDIVGNIRFGKILEALDKIAENTALAYVHRIYPGARVVTAAVDSMCKETVH